MNTSNFRGCGTALITPFRNGAVDYDAFAALVDRQVAAGIDFLVPLGTTGETPCLTDDEKIKLLRLTREHAGGIPVMAGVGTNSLESSLLYDSHNNTDSGWAGECLAPHFSRRKFTFS